MQKTMTDRTLPKKLALKKLTVRELTAKELKTVEGAAGPSCHENTNNSHGAPTGC
jgi:hypothetical protein